MDASSSSPPSSPKGMVIDVDALYPATPGYASLPPAKTPGWRIHSAPSPSPHIGMAARAALPQFVHFSPLAAMKGNGSQRGGRQSNDQNRERRAWSPFNDLVSDPPGWKRGNQD
jgi:hypothetical protein